MAEIPVEKKKAFPAWIGGLALLGLLGAVALVVGMRSCGSGAATTGAAAGARGCTGDGDCAEQQLCLAGACADIKAGGPDCAATRVHFDTDSSQIRDTDQAALDRTARCLKASQSTKLTIEGATDERGTQEHNAELGEKRAMAVARYLQNRGVLADQLKIVSYGENKALCVESDRECWARNRQAALKPQ